MQRAHQRIEHRPIIALMLLARNLDGFDGQRVYPGEVFPVMLLLLLLLGFGSGTNNNSTSR